MGMCELCVLGADCSSMDGSTCARSGSTDARPSDTMLLYVWLMMYGDDGFRSHTRVTFGLPVHYS